MISITNQPLWLTRIEDGDNFYDDNDDVGDDDNESNDGECENATLAEFSLKSSLWCRR